MELYWKALGAALLGIFLTITLERQGKDFSMLLTLCICIMLGTIGANYMNPILEYLGQLEVLGDLRSDLLQKLLKIFGIGMAGEMAASVCTDAGNSSLGKGLRFLSNIAILYLAIPVFTSLTGLLVQILDEV